MSILKLEIQDLNNIENPREGWMLLGFSNSGGTTYLTGKDSNGNIYYVGAVSAPGPKGDNGTAGTSGKGGTSGTDGTSGKDGTSGVSPFSTSGSSGRDSTSSGWTGTAVYSATVNGTPGTYTFNWVDGILTSVT